MVDISIDELRGLVGNHVEYQGHTCRVVEILDDGPALVLQDEQEPGPEFQSDQFGGPRRRVPRTYTVPVLTEDGNQFHSEFLEMVLEEGC